MCVWGGGVYLQSPPHLIEDYVLLGITVLFPFFPVPVHELT